MNPLFNTLNANNNPLMQLKAQAEQLKRSMNINPQEQVQQLLNSGQMSQEWLNKNLSYAQQIANQLFK